MTPLVQLDQYTEATSELTGRCIYLNDALDQFLVAPVVSYEAVSVVVDTWGALIDHQRAEHKPPPGMRGAVLTLKRCDTREALAAGLNTVLGQEYRDKLETTSIANKQRFVVDLMLRLWACGAVAWPAKDQDPFSNPAIALDNPAIEGPLFDSLTRIRAFLDRGGTDDTANFRFILDHLLSRAGLAEIGDITPETFYLTVERSRMGKLRSTGMQGVLQVLRDAYPKEALAW